VIPNTELSIGSVVTARLVVRNNGMHTFRNVFTSWLLSTEAVWEIKKAPPRVWIASDCSEPPEVPRCWPTHLRAEIPRLAAHETKILEVVAVIVDVRCPGRGDFVHEFFAGSSVEFVAKGPTGFRILAWFENEAAEYRKAVAQAETPRAVPSFRACKPDSRGP
jgi:hypothetical protein